MFFKLIKSFHISCIHKAAETSLLAKLRKKTGYTISNCKKALVMYNNDMNKAEKWLNDQAQAMGWEKAGKLANRKALQGLVGVKFDKKYATLVEINCETDFVARNEKFQKMLEDATLACYKFSHGKQQSSGPVTKMELGSEQLGNLTTVDGKKLSDVLALFIGTVGENAVLRRAICWKANSEDVKLFAYTHPPTKEPTDYYTGRYGAIVAYKQSDKNEDIGKDICLQILGCAPLTIGEIRKDQSTMETDGDKPVTKADENKPVDDAEEEISMNVDETQLINQDYLMDPSISVQEFLEERDAVVIDFTRVVCGEVSEAEKQLDAELQKTKQPLEAVQTLQ